MRRNDFRPKPDPRYRTIAEPDILALLLLVSWAYEIEAGGHQVALAATIQAEPAKRARSCKPPCARLPRASRMVPPGERHGKRNGRISASGPDRRARAGTATVLWRVGRARRVAAA